MEKVADFVWMPASSCQYSNMCVVIEVLLLLKFIVKATIIVMVPSSPTRGSPAQTRHLETRTQPIHHCRTIKGKKGKMTKLEDREQDNIGRESSRKGSPETCLPVDE